MFHSRRAKNTSQLLYASCTSILWLLELFGDVNTSSSNRDRDIIVPYHTAFGLVFTALIRDDN